MISTWAPAQEPGSARSARGTPRKVTSGPYIPPSLAIVSPEITDEPSMPRLGPGRRGACRSPGRTWRAMRSAPPVLPRTDPGWSVRRGPVHPGPVGGIGEVEPGIGQVAQDSRGLLPDDDPADVHPAH